VNTQLWIDLDLRNTIDGIAERGGDVSALRSRHDALAASVSEHERHQSREWQELCEDIMTADAGIDTGEPSTLEEIQASRPARRVDRYPGAVSDLEERIAGGWKGRVAGCVLGKPVECLMREKNSRAKLRELLEASGEYPIRDFISRSTMAPYWLTRKHPEWFQANCRSLRGEMRYAARDDDLDYTVLALRTVEELGRDFGPDQVIDRWLHLLPYGLTYTAERVAYRNRVLGMHYPETATFRNPYREWIGAQIRADLYGYICPGAPEEAARLAWQDAACSHTANGIYGAMWVAAAIAAAFHENEVETVILRGLEQVPARSRFAEHVLRTLDAAKANGDDFEATFDDIQARLGRYDCVHTINNASAVAAALVHGAGDYGRTICTAVMGGLDTDCNGATAGSIGGVMVGQDAIADQWVAPFNDELHTAIQGCHVMRISELIERTMALVE